MVYKIRKHTPFITLTAAIIAAVSMIASCADSRGKMTSDDSIYLAEVAAAEREGRPVPDFSKSHKNNHKLNSKTNNGEIWPAFPYTSIYDASYAEIFNDSNAYQFAFAQKIGITPISEIGQAYFTSKPIVHITTNENFVIDTLTHSVPFLVPEAAKLLNDIGAGFINKLKKNGYSGWRIIVTSLLRTPESVKKLRRVNSNATEASTHQYATTFDITYNKYYASSNATPCNEIELKRTLGEVLLELRRDKRCMVKYERKSPCFHITTTR